MSNQAHVNMKNKDCLSYNFKKVRKRCLAWCYCNFAPQQIATNHYMWFTVPNMLDWIPVARIWRKNAYGVLDFYIWYKKFKWYKMYDVNSNCTNHILKCCLHALNMNAIGCAYISAGRTSCTLVFANCTT